MLKGVALSVLASVLFGTLYYYTTLLQPLSGQEIFGWRMLFTLPAITLFLLASGEWHLVKNLFQRLREQPVLWLGLVLSSFLVGIQLWLFLWAPLHGHALNVSLGYFLMPLVMVLIGRFYYRERLSRLQVMAVLLAAAGAAHAVFQAGGLAWTSLLVCLGYPYYFVLRSQMKTDHLGGLWFDMLLTLPLAGYLALTGSGLSAMGSAFSALPWLVLLLGLLSAAAMVAYILSSRMLPFSLFGLLGYVEPVLLVGVALILGETITPEALPTYLAIWLALGLLGVESWLAYRRQKAGK
ncbi:MAG TPA: EamA family transporter RarD [Limnobacter sp.]|nr:EamA family transporter RarD [Limnobacter sp.]